MDIFQQTLSDFENLISQDNTTYLYDIILTLQDNQEDLAVDLLSEANAYFYQDDILQLDHVFELFSSLKETENAGVLAEEFNTIDSIDLYNQSLMTGKLMADLSFSVQKVYENLNITFDGSDIDTSFIGNETLPLILEEWILSDNVQAVLKDVKHVLRTVDQEILINRD